MEAPRRAEAVTYFPGLNGIRAIAACGVMVSHSLKELHRFPGHAQYRGLELATQGVNMFFTLSGFLITYLLLKERDQRGSVDLKAFYLRRILRIWPLYFFYLAAAMSFHWAFDPKGVPYASYVILFVLFMPNVAYSMRRYMPDTAPLWSIGIEEQFYALWPLVVSRVRRLEPLLIAVIITVLGLRTAMHVALGNGAHVATNIVESLGYDSMAIGALFAIWFRADNARLLRWAQSPFVHLAYGALVVLLVANRLAPLSLALNPITAVITAMFIVAQIAGRKKLLDLENPVLGYIGRISFGIYVYHMLVITLAVRIIGDRHVPGPAIIIGIAAASIALASLSYRVLETPFLRLKDRLAHIKTTR